MRKLHVVTTLLSAVALITVFQNCSSGSLPNVQDSTSSAANAGASADPLSLLITNQTPAPGGLQTLYAVGGTGPFRFSVTGGAGCSVDAGTGAFVAPAAAGVVCQMLVTDSRQQTAVGLITVTAASAPISSTPAAPVVTAGSISVDGPRSQSFVLPAYNTLTIEAWGGGGAGGTFRHTSSVNQTAGYGGSGSPSSVIGSSVNLSAAGGGGGTPYQMTASLAFYNGNGGSGGAGTSGGGNAGSPYGGGLAAGPGGGAGSTRNFSGGFPPGPAGAPGGGGGGYAAAGVSGGGGGGGGYSAVTYSVNGGPAVGSTLMISVGSGGLYTGLPGGENSSGAPGRVKISWQ